MVEWYHPHHGTVSKLVIVSAADAKLGARFLNAHEAKILHLILYKLGHPQPPTLFNVDNSTSQQKIKYQKSRVMAILYFWLLDHEAQSMFTFHY